MSNREFGAGLLNLMVLVGCASTSTPMRTTTVNGQPANAESLLASSAKPYWYFNATFIAVIEIINEDKQAILEHCLPGSGLHLGGRTPDILSCFDRRDGTIHVRNDLSAAQRKCVVRHEQKHAEGFDHFSAAPADTIFCGDGTKWVRSPGAAAGSQLRAEN